MSVKRIFPIILLFLSLLSSCRKKDKVMVPATQILNRQYAAGPQQTMDIYLPAGRNNTDTKVVIFIHGGGWSGGDKSDLTQYVDTLKKRLPGFAIFNINYRLAVAPDIFPTQELDVKSAIEFIYNNRDEFVISDKFILLGVSAGAHLALLHGYKNSVPVEIKALVDFFGPTDLTDMYYNPPNPLVPLLLSQVTGTDPLTDPAFYDESSPVHYVSSGSPPTLIFHGGMDIVVSSSQSVMLKNKLQAFGVAHEYYIYLSEGHGWTGPNLSDSFEKITQFITQYVP